MEEIGRIGFLRCLIFVLRRFESQFVVGFLKYFFMHSSYPFISSLHDLIALSPDAGSLSSEVKNPF